MDSDGIEEDGLTVLVFSRRLGIDSRRVRQRTNCG